MPSIRPPFAAAGAALAPVVLALAVLAPFAAPRAVPEAPSPWLDALIEPFTRDESVRVRIDAERGLHLDLASAAASGSSSSPATARGASRAVSAMPRWLVLGRGGGERDTAGTRRFVGALMGADGHVAITPPFVVLTRDGESLLLRVHAGGVEAEQPLPDWVRGERGGALVARFGLLDAAEIEAGSVRLRRRFVGP